MIEFHNRSTSLANIHENFVIENNPKHYNGLNVLLLFFKYLYLGLIVSLFIFDLKNNTSHKAITFSCFIFISYCKIFLLEMTFKHFIHI